MKRQMLERLMATRPSEEALGAAEAFQKYSRRGRRRVKDLVEKITTEVARRFRGYQHVFEDIEKARMLNNSRKHNKIISKSDWGMIIKRLRDKVMVLKVDPRNTSRRCPRCGMLNKPPREAYHCAGCGLEMNRHILAAINMYLMARNMEPSPQLFEELARKIRDKPSIVISCGERMRAERMQNIIARQLRLLGGAQATSPTTLLLL